MLSFRKKKYRIVFIITIITLIFNQVLISQEASSLKGTMNVGFEGGVQFTSVDDAYMIISEGGVGYSVGPFFDYYLSNIIKFRIGLNFDNRAFSLQNMDYIVDDSGYYGTSYYDVLQEFRVNYLTIPLSLIYIKGNDKFKFLIQGTFYYSVFINANQTGYTDVYISESDAPHFYFEGFPELNIPGHHYFDPDIQQLNTSDIGINLLFGFSYYIVPNLALTLSTGFTYSFGEVWENPERQASWSRIYKINSGIIYTLNSK